MSKVDLGYGTSDSLLRPRIDIEQIRSDPEISAMISIVMWNQHDMNKLYNDIHNEVIDLRNIVATALEMELIEKHDHQIALEAEGDKRF